MWAEPLRTLLVNVGRGSVRLSAVMSEATMPAKRTIVFSHATGFCKEVFLPVFRELRSLGLRDADLVALDLRTHGDSGVVNAPVLSPEAGKDWWELGSDVADFVAQLKRQRPNHAFYGVGHSCGAATMLMADKLVPGQFDGMVLIEPIIFPVEVSASGEDGLAAGAAKRRPNWTSREEAYQSYKKRAFASWSDETLRLYVHHSLRDLSAEEQAALGDGSTVTLKCKREHEMMMYIGGNSTPELYKVLPDITTPSLVLYGKDTAYFTPEHWQDIATRLVNATAASVAGVGHLLVMERPDLAATSIYKFIEGLKSTQGSPRL